MKLTIAVLGTTVVANVYAVAIDCTWKRDEMFTYQRVA